MELKLCFALFFYLKYYRTNIIIIPLSNDFIIQLLILNSFFCHKFILFFEIIIEFIIISIFYFFNRVQSCLLALK